jgi:hypothetical protein
VPIIQLALSQRFEGLKENLTFEIGQELSELWLLYPDIGQACSSLSVRLELAQGYR